MKVKCILFSLFSSLSTQSQSILSGAEQYCLIRNLGYSFFEGSFKTEVWDFEDPKFPEKISTFSFFLNKGFLLDSIIYFNSLKELNYSISLEYDKKNNVSIFVFRKSGLKYMSSKCEYLYDSSNRIILVKVNNTDIIRKYNYIRDSTTQIIEHNFISYSPIDAVFNTDHSQGFYQLLIAPKWDKIISISNNGKDIDKCIEIGSLFSFNDTIINNFYYSKKHFITKSEHYLLKNGSMKLINTETYSWKRNKLRKITDIKSNGYFTTIVFTYTKQKKITVEYYSKDKKLEFKTVFSTLNHNYP